MIMSTIRITPNSLHQSEVIFRSSVVDKNPGSNPRRVLTSSWSRSASLISSLCKFVSSSLASRLNSAEADSRHPLRRIFSGIMSVLTNFIASYTGRVSTIKEICEYSETVLPSAELLSLQGHKYTDYEIADGYYKRIKFFNDDLKDKEKKAAAKKTLRALETDMFLKAMAIQQQGRPQFEANVEELKRICIDPMEERFKRFSEMIEMLFKFMETKSMRMEPFQCELMRGFFLGIAKHQFKDELFKYKHRLLDLMGLASPEIATYNPNCPSKMINREIERIFGSYAKPYTAALAPRQCGKTTIMTNLLVVMIINLDIEILVQAQHKTMSVTIFERIKDVIAEMQTMSWFPSEKKLMSVGGTNETREFYFRKTYKKPTKVHFLSSSPNVSITKWMSIMKDLSWLFTMVVVCQLLQFLELQNQRI